MQKKIYCPDIECESCVKVLTRALKNIGASGLNFEKDSVLVDFDSEKVAEKDLLAVIAQKGYRAAFEPFERKTFGERFREFWENRQKYAVEYMMLRYAFFTFVILGLLDVFAFYAFFQKIPAFVTSYGWWLLYLDLAVVSIGSAIWHFKAYKARVTSMIGMMVGMTFGMQTGIMLGTILGATNGLFVGGVVGMTVAVGVGFYNGKCCGIMGVMEGMMAGVMGGVMGGMIGTMFRVDNILLFMPIFTLFNLLILLGLSYMLFEEVVEGSPGVTRQPVEFVTFFSYCLTATVILTIIMVYGPKTGLAVLGGTL